MLGNKLFDEVAELTGLPKHLIQEELALLLKKKGISPVEMTMESLREVLSEYLLTVVAQLESEGPHLPQ